MVLRFQENFCTGFSLDKTNKSLVTGSDLYVVARIDQEFAQKMSLDCSRSPENGDLPNLTR